MAGDVRVLPRQREIERLATTIEMRDALLEAAAPAVREAQSHAPKRTGAGAASIRAEAVLDGPQWEARLSWDQLHFYMRFHELGDRILPARPFLVPALRGLLT